MNIPANPDPAHIRVLLVEDNPVDAELVVEYLRETGCCLPAIEVATSCAEALSRLAARPFDVNLMDVNLPDTTGLQTVAGIVRSASCAVIVMTGADDRYLESRALQEGAQDYLTKGSFGPDTLARAIRYAMERHRARLELKEYNERLQDMVRERTLELEAALEQLRDEIDSRKQAEDEASRLALAVWHAGEAIAMMDPEGHIESVNPAFEEMTGYARHEIIGHHCRLLKSGKHSEYFYGEFYAALAAGKTWQGQFINRRKDEKLFTAESSVSPIRDEDGNVVCYIQTMLDVTDVEEMKEQLHRIQRLDSIGRLAGGVAHDFNNVLQAVIGYASISRAHVSEDSDLAENLDQVLNAARRASGLTRHLLAFSRSQPIKTETANLNAVFAGLMDLLRPLLREDIELEFTPEPDLGNVRIDVSQIEQIAMNMCLNARDAISGTGKITIETANVDVDDELAQLLHGCPPGPYVRLSISDNGCGMEPELVERIYDPFFTTKPHEVGTGLGLATVYGIVTQHDGYVECSSTPGVGTIFHVYLPRVHEAVSTPPEQPVFTPVPAAEQSVLVVEDEPILRKLTVRILTASGYRVHEAENGLEALARLDEHDEIQLVISDAVMPELGGVALFSQLASRPNAPRKILMSGYHHAALDPGHTLAGVEVLAKPFTPEQLLAAVQRTLGSTVPRHN